MRKIVFILYLFVSNLGLSQSALEMVPNGDFSKFDNFEIPKEVWAKKFTISKIYADTVIVNILDIYNYKPIGTVLYLSGVNNYFRGPNAAYMLNSWHVVRNREKFQINFDSMIYQDTFHFHLKNQYENSEIKEVTDHLTSISATKSISQIRVCGKNLYQMAAPLKVKTRTGAYYSVGLDLTYDLNTFILTQIYKRRITGSLDQLSNRFPFIQCIGPAYSSFQEKSELFSGCVTWCNITLDSNHYARNNNLKITLMNRYFSDSVEKNTPLITQDVWSMPLFAETDKTKQFNHRFKAEQSLSWLQLKQKHPDSIQYFPNDTIPFPKKTDSLFNLITDNGKRSYPWNPSMRYRLHPMLGDWPYVKQWQYPGKYRRYADKVLRNADYFLDNLSMQPEMYHNGRVAAPTILCEKDTFLAFIPTNEKATWTDLITGKVLSEGDSCWIHLVDRVSIEVKTSSFTDTLNYHVVPPESPFLKSEYILCAGDSVSFKTDTKYNAQWQFGTVINSNYTHHYNDTNLIQATLFNMIGCKFNYLASVRKAPNPTYFKIDTALCNSANLVWTIPNPWILKTVPGAVQVSRDLLIKTQADLQTTYYFIDTASGCNAELAVNIAWNQSPRLGGDIDTLLCIGEKWKMSLSPALWYFVNGQSSNRTLVFDTAGKYEIVAGYRSCSDTQIIKISIHPPSKYNYRQLNPTICFLDSALRFAAWPDSLNFYWDGSSTPSNLYSTMDTQRVSLWVVNQHGCRQRAEIQPEFACDKPVWIPNVFSPDSKGIYQNEFFQAHCISCRTTSMRIYNRWGECIYQGVGPWDGNYLGEPVPNGIYAYLLTLEITTGKQKQRKSFSGDVQVLR